MGQWLDNTRCWSTHKNQGKRQCTLLFRCQPLHMQAQGWKGQSPGGAGAQFLPGCCAALMYLPPGRHSPTPVPSCYTGVHAARRRSDASDASPVPRRVSGAGAAPAPAPRRTSGAASASPVPRRTSVGAAGRRTSIGAPAAVPAATRRRTSVGSDAPAAAPTPRRRTSLGYRAVGSAAAGIATPGGRASLAGDQSCSPLEAAFRSFASFGAGSSPAAGKVREGRHQPGSAGEVSSQGSGWPPRAVCLVFFKLTHALRCPTHACCPPLCPPLHEGQVEMDSKQVGGLGRVMTFGM